MRLAPKVKARYDNTPHPTVRHIAPEAGGAGLVVPANCQNCHTPLAGKATLNNSGQWVHRNGCPTKPKADQ